MRSIQIPHKGIRTREDTLYPAGQLPADAIVPHRFDGIIVGELMGPVDYTVKAATHEKSCQVLELSHPWFLERSPWGGVILLPCETWCQARVLSRWRYGRMNNQLWTSFDWSFYKPVLLGQTLHAYLKVIDKFWKRGRPFVRTEHWAEDDAGDCVHRQVEDLLLLLDLPADAKLR